MKRLEGKTALVMGGSGGLGGAVARRLALEGAKVCVHYRSNKERAEAVATDIRDSGGEAITHGGDASSRTDVDGLVSRCVESLGGLDILVNAAGMTREGPLMMTSDDDWRAVQEGNIDPVFQACRAALRPMIGQRAGTIVNISSVASRFANPGMVPYAATKGAVESLTRALSREVARFGIRVNAVAPGVIDTDMTQEIPDEVKEKIRGRIALDRFGTPGEIAGVVAFLASSDADYMTGQVLAVDGGM